METTQRPPLPQGQTTTALVPDGAGNGEDIIEDQQLYDWGIENRLDQYYHATAGGHHHHSHYQQQQQQQQQQPQQCYGQPHHLIQPQHSRMPASVPPAPPPPGQPPEGYQPEDQYQLPAHHQSLPPPVNDRVVSPTAPSQSDVYLDPKGAAVAAAAAAAAAAIPLFDSSEHKQDSSEQSKPATRSGRRPTLPLVDMDANEILKIERKRARNRVAASKCRLRKLERIAVLDNQAAQLRAENEELSGLAAKLKAQVYSLKQELRWHVNNGCKVFGGSKAQSASPDSTTKQEAATTVVKEET